MATRILSLYRTQVSELTLIPSAGGAFEVSAGEELIYSKLNSGTFPDEMTVVSALRDKI